MHLLELSVVLVVDFVSIGLAAISLPLFLLGSVLFRFGLVAGFVFSIVIETGVDFAGAGAVAVGVVVVGHVAFASATSDTWAIA